MTTTSAKSDSPGEWVEMVVVMGLEVVQNDGFGVAMGAGAQGGQVGGTDGVVLTPIAEVGGAGFNQFFFGLRHPFPDPFLFLQQSASSQCLENFFKRPLRPLPLRPLLLNRTKDQARALVFLRSRLGAR